MLGFFKNNKGKKAEDALVCQPTCPVKVQSLGVDNVLDFFTGRHVIIPKELFLKMPIDWQKETIICLEQYLQFCKVHGLDFPNYYVTARGADNRFIADPFSTKIKKDKEA